MTLNPSDAFNEANSKQYKTPLYVVELYSQYMGRFIITDVNDAYPTWVECETTEGTNPGWTPGEWIGYTATIQTKSGALIDEVVENNTDNDLQFYQSFPHDTVENGDSLDIVNVDRFCTYQPEIHPLVDVPVVFKPYLSYIAGGGFSVSPDEGTASSSTLKFELQDIDNDVTEMISTATGNLQKKRGVVKMGYLGMAEHELLTIFTGEVTNYSYKNSGTWEFSLSDAIRILNKNVFRDATEDNKNEIVGNPIDILLSLLISDKGDGTKGRYDIYEEGYGLDMDTSQIDIQRFEDIRDTYYPTTSVTFKFSIEDRISANDFFKDQIYKPLNMYPVVQGDGLYSARIYRPLLPPFSNVHINEDATIKIPSYDGNLADLINEVQFSYDYRNGDFEKIVVYADAESINDRGVGDRTLEIECEGLDSDVTDADAFMNRSVSRIFNRYAVPPIKINATVLFEKLVTETGDIIRFSNKFLPDLVTGSMGIDTQMEVLKRTVDWKRGSVKLELLQTGYYQKKYSSISPTMKVTGTGTTTTCTVEDISHYEVGFKCSVWATYVDDTNTSESVTKNFVHWEKIADNIEITEIDNNDITVSPALSQPFQDGWVITYNDDNVDVTDYQKAWMFIASDSDPDPYVIAP